MKSEERYIKDCLAFVNYTVIVLLSNGTLKAVNLQNEVLHGYAECIKPENIFLDIKFTKHQIYWGKNRFESILDIHIDQILDEKF